jgi:phage terminase large subunit GpA-like protein
MTQPHKVCPHCKKEVAWADAIKEAESEGDLLHYKIDCPHCGKEFELFMEND